MLFAPFVGFWPLRDISAVKFGRLLSTLGNLLQPRVLVCFLRPKKVLSKGLGLAKSASPGPVLVWPGIISL